MAEGSERAGGASGFVAKALSFEEFCAIEHEWDDLVAAGAHPLPFLSHPWLSIWWRHFGRGQRFLALVVRREGRLVAGLPLALRRLRPLGLPLTLAEITGTGPVPTRGMGLADKADAAVRAEHPEALPVLAAALDELIGREADVVALRGLDSRSPTAAALASRRPGASFVVPRSQSPFVELPGDWNTFLARRSVNFRAQLKSHRRKLEGLGSVEIVALDGRDAWRRAAPEVEAIDRRSWKGRRGTNLFRHPEIWSFLEELVGEMLDRGWMSVHVLRSGARAVAYEICFDFGSRIYSYNLGFDPDFSRGSPGNVLRAAIVEEACGRGRIELDLLRGMEPYKLRWSSDVRSESEVTLRGDGLAARAYTGLARAKRAWKRSPWLAALDDRLTGLLALRHRRP